jgi:hypothetical protein
MEFEESGQTLPSICTSRPPTPSHRLVPAAVQQLISKVGFRYQATSQTDLASHAARLALLADDLADMPVHYLDRAIRDWALNSPFMPKASDLVGLVRGYIASENTDTRTLAEKYNERMARDPKAQRGLMWVDLPDGGVRLVRMEQAA